MIYQLRDEGKLSDSSKLLIMKFIGDNWDQFFHKEIFYALSSEINRSINESEQDFQLDTKLLSYIRINDNGDIDSKENICQMIFVNELIQR